MLDATVRALCAQVALETDHKKCEALISRLAQVMWGKKARTENRLETSREMSDCTKDEKAS
jgi:hypothetical protein